MPSDRNDTLEQLLRRNVSDATLLRFTREQFLRAKATILGAFRHVEAPIRLEDASTRYGSLGAEMLGRGRVAILTVAGGRSLRMGGRFRGSIEVGPVTSRTLFDIHGEQIAAIQGRLRRPLLWLIMTSAYTEQPIRDALVRRGHYGLPVENVLLFPQPSLPVLSDNLEPISESGGAWLTCPTGHGGMLSALRASGVIDQISRRGAEHLFVFQYPNAMEQICDVGLLGLHAHLGSDVTVKGIFNSVDGDRVGRLVNVKDRLQVVEYHTTVTTEQAERLSGAPFYSGTAVWSIAFLRRCIDEDVQLPFYVLPYVDVGVGGSAWKLEQFVFDLLAHTESAALAVGLREDHYAVIKSAVGRDTVAHARECLTARYRRWLDTAGAVALGDVHRLEISARVALDANELLQRLPAGFQYSDGLVLDTQPRP